MTPAARPDLVIETPEGVAFRLPLAGPMTRMTAVLVDHVLVAVIATALSASLRVAGAIAPDFAQGLLVISYFALQVLYPMVLEWVWRGQTVGKRLFGLRVVDAEGLRLQFSQVVVRNLLRVVDVLPLFYGLGGAVMVLGGRGQRLGDIAASTVVVKPRPVHRRVDAEVEAALDPDGLAGFPALSAELRRQVSPVLGSVMVEALARRDAFDPEARIRVFAEIRRKLDPLVHVPDEAVRGLSDEQWVRKAASAVYRRRGASGVKPGRREVT